MTDVMMTTVFPTFRAAARGHDRIPFGIIAHCTATVPSPPVAAAAAFPPPRDCTRGAAAVWYRRSGALHRPRSDGLARRAAAAAISPTRADTRPRSVYTSSLCRCVISRSAAGIPRRIPRNAYNGNSTTMGRRRTVRPARATTNDRARPRSERAPGGGGGGRPDGSPTDKW